MKEFNIDLKKLLAKSDRRQVSFYLSQRICQQFHCICDHQNVSGSKVLEQLMMSFIAAVEKRPKNKKEAKK